MWCGGVLQVQDSVGEVQRLFVRFNGHPKEWPGALPNVLAWQARRRAGADVHRGLTTPLNPCHPAPWGAC